MFKLKDVGITSKTVKLNNGANVSFFIKKNTPISMLLVYPTGAANDPDDKQGLTHLFEHLAMQTGKLDKQIENLGGWSNASTYKEEVVFYAQIPLRQDIEALIKLLINIIPNMKVKNKEFATEKKVVLTEIQLIENNPTDYLYDLLERSCLTTKHLTTPTTGTINSVKHLELGDIENLQKQISKMPPAIIITGDIDSSECENLLNAHSIAYDKNSIIQFPNGKFSPKNVLEKNKSDFITLGINFRVAPMFSAEQITLDFIKGHIGYGITSPIIKRLRSELGIIYWAQVNNYTYQPESVFSITFECNKTNVWNAVNEISILLNRLKRTGATPAGLTRTKRKLLKKAFLDYYDPYNVGWFHTQQSHNENFIELEQQYSMTGKITNKEIITVAQKYFVPERLGFAAIGNIEMKTLNNLKELFN